MIFSSFLKRLFKIKGHYLISSKNNFPTNLGAASSASSFSALVKASFELAQKTSPLDLNTWKMEDLAFVSRVGSGSSARSFFNACLFDEEGIKEVSIPWKNLKHQFVLGSEKEKEISSSEAHIRIKSSPYFKERGMRVKTRLLDLNQAFKETNWKKTYEICLEEFQDMHKLFASSNPPFSYSDPLCNQALEFLKEYWRKNKDGPLITKDAGSGLHLLYKEEGEKNKKGDWGEFKRHGT